MREQKGASMLFDIASFHMFEFILVVSYRFYCLYKKNMLHTLVRPSIVLFILIQIGSFIDMTQNSPATFYPCWHEVIVLGYHIEGEGESSLPRSRFRPCLRVSSDSFDLISIRLLQGFFRERRRSGSSSDSPCLSLWFQMNRSRRTQFRLLRVWGCEGVRVRVCWVPTTMVLTDPHSVNHQAG